MAAAGSKIPFQNVVQFSAVLSCTPMMPKHNKSRNPEAVQSRSRSRTRRLTTLAALPVAATLQATETPQMDGTAQHNTRPSSGRTSLWTRPQNNEASKKTVRRSQTPTLSHRCWSGVGKSPRRLIERMFSDLRRPSPLQKKKTVCDATVAISTRTTRHLRSLPSYHFLCGKRHIPVLYCMHSTQRL